MTERLALYEIEKLTDRFGLTSGVPKGVKKHYNISPTQLVPVIVQRDDTIQIEMMHWGLVPTGSKDNNSVFRYKTFNVNADKVHARAVTDYAVRHQRCLVPVNGFYQWERAADGKAPYFVSAPGKSLVALAGIYSLWTDPNGVQQQTFSILTTEANKTMPLPHDRMPVIVHSADEKKWLDPTITDFSTLVQMMRPFEGDALNSHEVSADINSKKLDTPALMAEVMIKN